MDVVPPQQMVGDYPPDRCRTATHAFERERFVRL